MQWLEVILWHNSVNTDAIFNTIKKLSNYRYTQHAGGYNYSLQNMKVKSSKVKKSTDNYNMQI